MQGGSRVASRRRSLLTTRTAADTAACDIVTIRRAIARGELQALRLGSHGDYRIPSDELERWLRPAQDTGHTE